VVGGGGCGKSHRGGVVEGRCGLRNRTRIRRRGGAGGPDGGCARQGGWKGGGMAAGGNRRVGGGRECGLRGWNRRGCMEGRPAWPATA